jgi:hypothetical protein
MENIDTIEAGDLELEEVCSDSNSDSDSADGAENNHVFFYNDFLDGGLR